MKPDHRHFTIEWAENPLASKIHLSELGRVYLRYRIAVDGIFDARVLINMDKDPKIGRPNSGDWVDGFEYSGAPRPQSRPMAFSSVPTAPGMARPGPARAVALQTSPKTAPPLPAHLYFPEFAAKSTQNGLDHARIGPPILPIFPCQG